MPPVMAAMDEVNSTRPKCWADVGQRALGEEERRGQVDGQRLVEQSCVDLFITRPLAEPGIRRQHIDEAARLYFVHQAARGLRVSQVGGEDLRLAAGGSYRAGYFFGGRPPGAEMNCHPGAREPEPAAQRRPDPAAATGHQRDLAGKNGTGIAHRDPFLRPPSIGKATASLGVTKATLSITTAVTTGVNLHGGRAQIGGGRWLEG